VTKTLECFNGGKHWLVLVFASSLVLSSLMTLAGNYLAFADTVSSTIPVGSGDGTFGINTATNKIYLTNFGNNSITVIDGSTNTVANSIAVERAVATDVNPNTNKIYSLSLTTAGNGQISVIDGNTNQIVGTMGIQADVGGFIAVDSSRNLVYVLTECRCLHPIGLLYMINGTTDSIAKSITVGIRGWALGVNQMTDKIYTSDGDFVYVIDGATFAITNQISTGGYIGIGINPNTNMIYVANSFGNTTDIIDGASNSIVNKIKVGIHPEGVRVNQVTNKIYVANAGDNTVSVIDGSTNSVTQTLQVGSSPNEVGVNQITNRIYVGNSGTLSVIDGGSSNTSTVPSAPQNLQASGSNSQVTLSWAASASNGGSAITGYEIERSTDNGNTWSVITSNTGSTATTYSDTGLSPSTSYTYRVSAINSVGTSSPSNTASATTSAVIPPPTGIVLNNIQSTSGVAPSSNQITLANFDAGTGNNRLLVVGVSANNNDVASVTFGGMSLTNKVKSFYNNDAEFWYLKNPTGAGNIVVTMNGPTSVVVGAYSFSGVNQTSPLPTSTSKHNTTPNSPNITITTKFANDWVLDLPSIYGGSTLGSPTCTQQWDVNVANAITGASSSATIATPGSVTCKWTASSADFWDDVAIEIKASK
jgi:YVTN family beta-propeller protein